MKPPRDESCIEAVVVGRDALWDEDVLPAEPIIFK